MHPDKATIVDDLQAKLTRRPSFRGRLHRSQVDQFANCGTASERRRPLPRRKNTFLRRAASAGARTAELSGQTAIVGPEGRRRRGQGSQGFTAEFRAGSQNRRRGQGRRLDPADSGHRRSAVARSLLATLLGVLNAPASKPSRAQRACLRARPPAQGHVERTARPA